jgi:hypothetical protein
MLRLFFGGDIHEPIHVDVFLLHTTGLENNVTRLVYLLHLLLGRTLHIFT